MSLQAVIPRTLADGRADLRCNQHCSNWNEERTELLRKLWDDGKTAAEIAKELNRDTGSSFTRNAILGKSDRLSLSMRTRSFHNPNLTDDERKERRRTRRARQARELKPWRRPSRRTRFSPAIDDLQIPESQRRQLIDLDNHHCRWPVGEVGVNGFFFCGSPLANLREGRPYCPGHMFAAVRPTETRKAA